MTKVYYIEPKHFDEAAANGIHAGALRDRVYDFGWDIEEAITRPLRQIDDYYYQIAKANGIHQATYYGRINDHGWTKEAAATTPPYSQAQSLAAANRKKRRLFTDEQIAAAKANNLPRSTLYSRVYRGWDADKAANTPALTREQQNEQLRQRENGLRAVINQGRTMAYQQKQNA